MASKILLILGVTGVGKSTIINNLLRLDSNFKYIQPYTNRPKRDFNDNEKVYVSDKQLNVLIDSGKILIVNDIYKYKYATPKQAVLECLANNQFPVLDFPIQKLAEFKSLLPDSIYSVYIVPANLEELKRRLTKGRIDRLEYAIDELKLVEEGQLVGYDEKIINPFGRNQNRHISNFIYQSFINSM